MSGQRGHLLGAARWWHAAPRCCDISNGDPLAISRSTCERPARAGNMCMREYHPAIRPGPLGFRRDCTWPGAHPDRVTVLVATEDGIDRCVRNRCDRKAATTACSQPADRLVKRADVPIVATPAGLTDGNLRCVRGKHRLFLRAGLEVGRPGILGAVVANGEDQGVAVTWAKDRTRWKRALREFPVARAHRRLIVWGMFFSILLVILVISADPQDVEAHVLVLCMLPAALAAAAVSSTRRALLSSVTEGTITWRLSEVGLRIEGDSVLEYPWSQVVVWRRAAGHLIVEIRQAGRRMPRSAAAAPLEAFNPESWSRAERLLSQRVGDEAVLADRAHVR